VVHSSSSSDEGNDSDSDMSEQECFAPPSAARGNGNCSAAVSGPGQQAQRPGPAAAAAAAGKLRISGSRANVGAVCSNHSSDSDSSSSEAEDDDGYDNFRGDDDAENDMSEDGGPWGDGGSEDEEGLGLEEGLAGALQSMLPFLDTKGVTVHLSEFGLMWNTLHGWVSPVTVDYVNHKQQQQQFAGAASSSTSSSNTFDATEQQQQHGAEDGQGPQNAQQQVHVPPLAVVQQRTALANLLSQALPLVTQQLGITSSQPEISKHLNALVRSFYMPGPLPALQAHQWQLLVSLLLGALSAWRLPALRPLFVRGQGADSKLGLMLSGVGCDVDRFMALLDLFELDV
jgi:hypothetical protein